MQISTERLLLRPLLLADAPALFAIRSDDAVGRYIDRTPDLSPADTRAFIQRILEAEGTPYWAILKKADDTLIGTICLWQFTADGRRAEIGYELHPPAQGQGYMHEALEAVLAFAWKTRGLQEILAITHGEHLASQRLLSSAGFDHSPGRESAELQADELGRLTLWAIQRPTN